MAGYVKSDAIGYLQKQLGKYYKGSDDQIWGPQFGRALEKFAKYATGYPEDSTLRNPPGYNEPKKQLEYAEMLAAEIKRTVAVQESLNAAGFEVGRADGVWGGNTTNGYMAFKAAYEAKRADHPGMQEFPESMYKVTGEQMKSLRSDFNNPPTVGSIVKPLREKLEDERGGVRDEPNKRTVLLDERGGVRDAPRVKEANIPAMHQAGGYSRKDVGTFQMDVFRAQMMLTAMSRYGMNQTGIPNYESTLGGIDGRFGHGASTTLALFQDNHPDLEKTGNLDAATWKALHETYNQIPEAQRLVMETSLQKELLSGGVNELGRANSSRRMMATTLVAHEFDLSPEDARALYNMPAGRWSMGHPRILKDAQATILDDGDAKQVTGKGTFYAGKWLNSPVAGSSKHYPEMFHQSWHFTFAANNEGERQAVRNDARGIMPSSAAKLGQVYRTDNGILLLCNSSGGFGSYKDRVADLAPAAATAYRADYKARGVVPIALDYEHKATLAYWRRQEVLGLPVPEGVQAEINEFLANKDRGTQKDGRVANVTDGQSLIEVARASVTGERFQAQHVDGAPTDVKSQQVVIATDQDNQRTNIQVG